MILIYYNKNISKISAACGTSPGPLPDINVPECIELLQCDCLINY